MYVRPCAVLHAAASPRPALQMGKSPSLRGSGNRRASPLHSGEVCTRPQAGGCVPQLVDHVSGHRAAAWARAQRCRPPSCEGRGLGPWGRAAVSSVPRGWECGLGPAHPPRAHRVTLLPLHSGGRGARLRALVGGYLSSHCTQGGEALADRGLGWVRTSVRSHPGLGCGCLLRVVCRKK